MSSPRFERAHRLADLVAVLREQHQAGRKVTDRVQTTEAGGTATFTIVLLSAPTASVTVPLSSSNTKEGTFSPASVFFSTANWATPQVVTVKGVDDAVADGDQSYTVVLGAAVSTDPNYSGFDATDVQVTNTDNDMAGVVATPMGSVTTEGGGRAAFTVGLRSQPTATVTIMIASDRPGEGTPSPSSVVFSVANWATPQVVTVTGVDDNVADGDAAYNVNLGPAISADPAYNGTFAQALPFINVDNDVAGVLVGIGSTTTTEGGGTATFTVALRSQPTVAVTIPLVSTDPSEGHVSVPALMFGPANWSMPQVVVVTGVDDAVADGNVPYAVTVGPATGGDPAYNGLAAQTLPFVNIDNDTPGFVIGGAGALVTTEAGGTAAFTLALQSQPAADVTVMLSSSKTGEGVVAPTMMTFSVANWSAAHVVTITGVADAVKDGDVPYMILGGTISGDPAYAGLLLPPIEFVNRDND